VGRLKSRDWTAPPADQFTGRPVGMVLISAAENFRCPFIVPTSAISADRIKVIFSIRPENPASLDPCERRRPGHRPLTEDGHPGRLGRRASSLPESHPHRQPPPIQIPSPTPTRRKGGGAFPSCRQPQRNPPSSAGTSRQGHRAGWLVKPSSSVLTVSQLLRYLILPLIVSQNVKMRGPTPNTTPNTWSVADECAPPPPSRPHGAPRPLMPRRSPDRALAPAPRSRRSDRGGVLGRLHEHAKTPYMIRPAAAGCESKFSSPHSTHFPPLT
jgi:hypothetical protein